MLGGGSAGFAASIRAADLGARVTLIEAGTLGGTCVNVGCVPSKTLIRAADIQHRARYHPFDGVRTAAQAPDFAGIMAQKDALVAALRQEKYRDVLSSYSSVTLRQGRGLVNADLSVTLPVLVLALAAAADPETWIENDGIGTPGPIVANVPRATRACPGGSSDLARTSQHAEAHVGRFPGKPENDAASERADQRVFHAPFAR